MAADCAVTSLVPGGVQQFFNLRLLNVVLRPLEPKKSLALVHPTVAFICIVHRLSRRPHPVNA